MNVAHGRGHTKLCAHTVVTVLSAERYKSPLNQKVCMKVWLRLWRYCYHARVWKSWVVGRIFAALSVALFIRLTKGYAFNIPLATVECWSLVMGNSLRLDFLKFDFMSATRTKDFVWSHQRSYIHGICRSSTRIVYKSNKKWDIDQLKLRFRTTVQIRYNGVSQPHDIQIYGLDSKKV